MRTYFVGDTIQIPEHDGIISRTISAIFWREKNKGNDAVEKLSVLAPALQWCVVLFEDGTWINGSEIKATDTKWRKDMPNMAILSDEWEKQYKK